MMGKKRRKCMLKSRNRILSVFFFYFFMCTFLLHSSFHFSYAGDTMQQGSSITDNYHQVTLVSEREIFEFGFFSPPGAEGRYVGIWYYNLTPSSTPNLTPKTVVWVANRANPLLSAGIFSINKDGNLELSDGNGVLYWSTSLAPSPASNRTLKLMDSGNLVLRDENDQSAMSLWQSFENASDTFLPGMKMDEKLMLISWSSEDDPGLGDFTFKQDLERKDQYIIMKKAIPYWKSRARGEYFSSDWMPISISYLLSNFSEKIPGVYSYKRLVMGSTGNVLYQQWLHYSKEWSLIWSEPRDKCSVLNVCGDFGSCNSNYEALACKCLPGFEPRFAEKWGSGNFSGGCSRPTVLCRKDDEFLKLERMKVGERGMSRSVVNNGSECRKKCLDNCHCRGYAYESSNRRGENSTATATCWTWLDYLNDLQEECTDGGRNFFLRIPLSVLEPKPRTCHPCGTTLVPYPLSTGPDCGDPMYFSFKCNNNSILTFKALNGEYPVVGNINSSRKAFSIQGENSLGCNDFENSEAQNLRLNETLFNVTKIVCYQAINASKVEIQWNSPQEPICDSAASCRGWPNSTCHRTKDGSRRCLCETSFAWDGPSLSCIHVGKEGSSRKGIPSFLVAVATAAGVLVLAFAVISFLICRRKMAKKEDKRSGQRNRALLQLDSQRHIKTLIDSGTFEEDESNVDVPCFSLESVIAATDDFSDANKLGQGGYGPVYKGTFPGGQEIAIKRLSSVSGQGLQEFKNEVVLIAKLQHRDLVRLRGYCLSGDEKLLLYEYMPNRSLDSFIFDPTKSMLLDWETRFNIILGIARGLLYLHQDSRLRIIHRDMKTSNILLDQEMNPKISDFGLARMVGGKQTEANTSRVVGTYGYMSPEYALEGLFSVKSDVFSFGVVLLEIISGKRNTRFFQSGQALSLLAYAWRLWTEDKKLDLLDQTLQGSCKKEQFIKCMNVGLLCVQEDPSDRPNMSNVITMLDGESTTLPSPKQPAFIIRRGSGTASSSSSKPNIHAEITLTLEEGR